MTAMSNGRESQVLDTFLALTDTLVRAFDALDMLTMLTMLTERSVDLLDVTAAGVILTDGTGTRLSVAAARRKPPGCWRCSRSLSAPGRAWTACAAASP